MLPQREKRGDASVLPSDRRGDIIICVAPIERKGWHNYLCWEREKGWCICIALRENWWHNYLCCPPREGMTRLCYSQRKGETCLRCPQEREINEVTHLCCPQERLRLPEGRSKGEVYVPPPSPSGPPLTPLPLRAQELCESRGDRPGLPAPNSSYGLCGRKATVSHSGTLTRQAISRFSPPHTFMPVS